MTDNDKPHMYTELTKFILSSSEGRVAEPFREIEETFRIGLASRLPVGLCAATGREDRRVGVPDLIADPCSIKTDRCTTPLLEEGLQKVNIVQVM